MVRHTPPGHDAIHPRARGHRGVPREYVGDQFRLLHRRHVGSVVGTVAHFALQGAWVTGGGWSDVFSWSSWGDVSSSRLGAALLVRLVLVLLWAAYEINRGDRTRR